MLFRSVVHIGPNCNYRFMRWVKNMRLTKLSDIVRVLKESHNIAVVGLSDDPYRPSNHISSYLIEAGYNVIPVNPTLKEVLGLSCYPSLLDIPGPVDMVDVFRNPAHVMPVVEDAIAKGIKVIWFQLGVINEEAIDRAVEAGLDVVVNRCTAVEHARNLAAITA